MSELSCSTWIVLSRAEHVIDPRVDVDNGANLRELSVDEVMLDGID